jgi:hypothetical protein
MDPTTVQKAMYLLQKVQIEGAEIPMWNEVMSEFQTYCQPQQMNPIDDIWKPPPPDLPEPI